MNPLIRIPQSIHEQIVADLARHHWCAFERVGFLATRQAMVGTRPLILPYEYRPVADEDYNEELTVGASINSKAIQKALQWAMDTRGGIFHVHIHPGNGRPRLSKVDQDGLPPLIPGFQAVQPQASHGLLIFSANSAAGWVWRPGRTVSAETTDISVVGSPLQLMR